MQSFSENAIRLLNDKKQLNRLAGNAEKTILSKYTPEAQGQLCKQFYLQLTRGNV
jgi:hypothetical protein